MELLHFPGEKKGALPHTLNRTGHCLGNQRKENTVLLKDDQIVFLPLVGGQLFHSTSDQINIKEAPMGPAQSTLSLGSALRVEVASCPLRDVLARDVDPQLAPGASCKATVFLCLQRRGEH